MKTLMKWHYQNLMVFVFSWFIITALSPTLLPAAEGYEPQQDLTASDVLPKSFFESDLYQVDPKVKNDGLMNKYLFGHVKAWQL